jgi:hypothetical protein
MADNLEGNLRSERERLLQRALSAAGFRDLVELQAELAESIRRSEVARRQVSRWSAERALWKYHDQQLRVVGDTLAWLALDGHTIRNLGKGPGRPASLSGQWSDFQFVLQTARTAADLGLIVLVCDVTNVLRAGDLVLQFAGGELEVIECKNVDAEALSRRRDPRVTRQINRGQQLARYLTAGELTGRATEIPVPEGHEAVQQAVKINHEPKHDWSLLLDAIEHAAAIGTGLSKKSTEFVLVQRHDAPALTNLDLPRPSNADSTKALLVAFASDIIDNPSPLHPPVTAGLSLWNNVSRSGSGTYMSVTLLAKTTYWAVFPMSHPRRSLPSNRMAAFTFAFTLKSIFLVLSSSRTYFLASRRLTLCVSKPCGSH